jgi:DNA-binding transcriptional LysR family regulator
MMDIRGMDLNLLVAFDSMIEYRSVTRAAEALGLSQPAMSAAVARLRKLFGDPLFVKTGSEMRATPRANELAAPVRRVMDTVKSEILQLSAFDAAVSTRTFTIITPDIGEINFLPKVLARLAFQAPGANLRTLSMPRHATSEALESGAADLAVGYFPDLHKAGFYQQRLFRNELVCIVRSDHPTIGKTLALKAYLAAKHAVVRPEGREHVFEQFLHGRNLKRRVVVEIAHFMSLLPILTSTDLVATVPKDLADVCAKHAPIKILACPIKSPAIEVHQFWHQRFHKEAANVWLRAVINDLFRD